MKIIKIVLLVVMFLIALALGSQNQIQVNFNYLLAQDEFQLATLLCGAFVLGFVCASLVLSSLYLKSQLSLRKRIRQLKTAVPATTPSAANAE